MNFDLRVTSERQKGGTEVKRYLDDWEGEHCGLDSDDILAWWKMCAKDAVDHFLKSQY